MKGNKLISLIAGNLVPIIFIAISAVAIPLSGFSASYLVQELLIRIGRNSFLVLSLLIPIMAGMGLNFGMVLGAMAGQIGLIMVADWAIVGVPGVVLAMMIGTPIAAILGWLCGATLNRAKGQEMVTGYILGFFINGLYQLVVLYFMGWIIPVSNPSLLLSRGYGVRNSLNLIGIRGVLDNLIPVSLPIFGGTVRVPLVTLIVIAVFCIFIVWFRKTKLGQIIFLQNMGTLNTYNSHDQTGMFSIAALLIGGASVSRASISNVFVGVILFHLMFIVAPMAGKNLMGQAQIGEYFRVFVSYGIIALALVLHAWKRNRDRELARRGLRGTASAASTGKE